MILRDISPCFKTRLDRLERWASIPSLWRDHADKVLEDADSDDLSHADDAFELLHRMQRLEYIFSARMENHKHFRDVFYRSSLPTWKQFVSPPVTDAMIDSLAEKLYNVRSPKDVPMLEIGDHARKVGCVLFDRCVAEKINFDVSVMDENFKAILLNNCTIEQAAGFGETYALSRAHITNRIMALYNLPEGEVISTAVDVKRAYNEGAYIFRKWVLSGKINSTLTMIPTRKDAEIDQLDYDQYVADYFTMCNQDWVAIGAAQEILIEKLNAAKTLRFTNNDGTDLSMNIDGFTFCNSLTARNVPGSEAFSAPKRDSVNGTIVAKGRFAPKGMQGAIVENITMHFKDGFLHDYSVDSGLDVFEETINTDAGARYIGEVGIGTNPYWKTHVANILLSEKIGGSFHVALGDAYTMTNYMGTPVTVDNGNRSNLHWDITTMLWGKQGRIYADGNVIMEDGLWVDPALALLNGTVGTA